MDRADNGILIKLQSNDFGIDGHQQFRLEQVADAVL